MSSISIQEDMTMHTEHAAPPARFQPEAAQPFDPRRKSARLAVFLSFVPGMGQVYVGYYTRALVIAATWLLTLMIAANAPGDLQPAPAFAVIFIWLFNVIDAGRLAALYNHAMSGARSIELPEDFKMPSMGGSIVGGVVLAVFGALALSNTLFGMRLDWLEQWWPAFPLALGLYLVARGIKDRAAAGEYAAAAARARAEQD